MNNDLIQKLEKEIEDLKIKIEQQKRKNKVIKLKNLKKEILLKSDSN